MKNPQRISTATREPTTMIELSMKIGLRLIMSVNFGSKELLFEKRDQPPVTGLRPSRDV